MKITQVRNATIIVDYNNTKFLLDPWFMPKDAMPGFDTAINAEIRQPRVDLPMSIDKIIDVDAVIVTHIHPDHWDEYAEKALDKNIKLFVQSDVDKKYVESKGFMNVEVLMPEGVIFKGTMLYKTGCQHGKRETIKPLCEQMGMPYDSMGVVFKSEGEKTLYIAGDTIWCEEVVQALDKFKPEVIVLNACAAMVLTGERIIMNIDDIKEVMQKSPNATIIASHMDTVSHLSVTREDLRKYKEENQANNLLIPLDGTTVEINL